MSRTNAILVAASVAANVCLAVLLFLQREHSRELEEKLVDLRASVNPEDAAVRPGRSDVAAGDDRPAATQQPPSTAEFGGDAIEIDRGTADHLISQAVLLRDPSYRSLRLTGEKNTLYMVHAEAIAALQLSPDATDNLVTLLAEHALESVERPSGRWRHGTDLDAGADPANPPRWRVKEQLNEQRRQAEIEASIGTEKYREWREFYESKPARYQVALLEKEVETIGEPLRPDQRKNLVNLMTDEARLQPAKTIRGPGVPQPHLATLEAEAARIEASNERLLQLAASYLAPKQLEFLQRSLDRKRDWARTHVDLERQRLKISQSETAATRTP